MKIFQRGSRSRGTGLAAGLLSLGLVAAACGGGNATGSGGDGGGSGGGSSAAGGKTITIGWIPWNEDIAITNLWEHILEKRGYKVETVQLPAAQVYAGLANEDVDVFLDAWLPNTHQQYWEEYGDKLTKVSAWYDNGTLEMTVPAYMDAQSIGDLKKHGEALDYTITGIDAGAGITDKTQKSVMPKYGLKDKWNLKISSTSAMLAALKGAVADKEPIVVTLWHPHVAYSKYDLRDLKDPKNAWGKGEKLWVVGRGGFGEDYPKISKWLKNFHLTKQQLREMEDLMFNSGKFKNKPDKAIDQWVSDHQDLVNKWVGSSS